MKKNIENTRIIIHTLASKVISMFKYREQKAVPVE